MVLVGAQKIRMLMKMKTVKARFRRFQLGIKVLLTVGLQAVYEILSQKLFCILFSETLQKTEFRESILTDVVKEIQRQTNGFFF